MEIHLIRHGQTLATEQGLYCGKTDLKLSHRGITELINLKAMGIYPTSADSYFTSGLARTEETLDMLYGRVPRKAIPQLSEFNFGIFEMKCHDELIGKIDYKEWIEDTTGMLACPDGESKHDFALRVSEGFKILCNKASQCKSVLLICHGGVIVRIMEQLYPGERGFYEWQPKPGRGYSLALAQNDVWQYKQI